MGEPQVAAVMDHGRPPFSVIIPAHNEASVITRCLTAIIGGSDTAAQPEIVVVCNGCSDKTAEIARQTAPQVQVIELQQGSKILALNAGNAAASALPRFFIDADVVVSGQALAAVAEVLAPNGPIMAAAPALAVDLTGCSAPVRSYYRVWLRQPYVQSGTIGSGFYGLSAKGVERVGQLPPIIADDLYVRTRFAPEERQCVRHDAAGQPVQFTIFPPRDLSSLLRIESRRRAGDMQLAQQHPAQHNARTTTPGSLLSQLGKGVSVTDLAWYLAIKTIGRLWAKTIVLRKVPIVWQRDDSSR